MIGTNPLFHNSQTVPEQTLLRPIVILLERDGMRGNFNAFSPGLGLR